MNSHIEYKGRTYETRPSEWLRGIKNVVICGKYFHYPPDMGGDDMLKVIEIEIEDNIEDPLKVNFYEPATLMDFLNLRLCRYGLY